jgi:uncharacterized integral membrane protein
MLDAATHAPLDAPAIDAGSAASAGDAPAAAQPQIPAAQPQPIAVGEGVESRGARFVRMAHRTRLHLYALVTVAVLVYLVALATSNTHRVRIDWVFASSRVPLVWLMLFAAILGWLLGILITILFRMRTRAPRQHGAETPTATAVLSPDQDR